MSKNLIATLLGIVIGYRGVSFMVHTFYLSAIALLVFTHFFWG